MTKAERAITASILILIGLAMAAACWGFGARMGDPRRWGFDFTVAAAVGGAVVFVLLGSELASWFISLRPIPAGLRRHLPTLWEPTGPNGERLPTESLDDLFGADFSTARRLIAMGLALFQGFIYLALLVPLHSTLALRVRADLQRGWTVPGLLAGLELVFAASWVAYLVVRSRSQASADSASRK
jgi:hypothetical protein